MPKVSVCIPAYNGEKYIEKAIESVLRQSYTNFELVIIDDASKDKTKEIVNSFSDKRIRFIKNEINIGMVENWNRCLDNAIGEYILLLGNDDFIAENCLEKKVNAFDINDEICLVFSSSYIVNETDKIVMRKRPFHSEQLFDGKDLGRRSFIRKNLYGEPSNVLFKREVSKKVGCFDNRICYSTDWDYWMKLCLLGKAYYIDEYLMYYRISNTSVTSKLLKNINKSKLEQDDAQLVRNCLRNMELSKMDVILHKFNIKLRTFARKIFLKLNAIVIKNEDRLHILS